MKNIEGNIMNEIELENKIYECKEKNVGVVSITNLLKDIVSIKKYALDKKDEKVYLFADNLEQQLNWLRYGNFVFKKDW